MLFSLFFFFNDTATTEIYTLSLHDALPISRDRKGICGSSNARRIAHQPPDPEAHCTTRHRGTGRPPPRQQHQLRRKGNLRSEEHTSELQSRQYLVCRLLLEKKKNNKTQQHS